jgi:hypothetical protein
VAVAARVAVPSVTWQAPDWRLTGACSPPRAQLRRVGDALYLPLRGSNPVTTRWTAVEAYVREARAREAHAYVQDQTARPLGARSGDCSIAPHPSLIGC